VVLQTRDSLLDEDRDGEEMEEDKSMELIWQALLSGVTIQVAWVCLVWLFSRGRICAV
jgi:hypothetical protein